MEETKLKPCPFCGGLAAAHPNKNYTKDYYAIYHEEDCYLNNDKPPYNFTLIPKTESAIKAWNTRHAEPKLNILTLIEKYKKEWGRADEDQKALKSGGKRNLSKIELGKTYAYAEMINDLVLIPHAADVPTERLCVFCRELCEDAPTERGWAEVPYNKGLHFDCAKKVAGITDVPDENWMITKASELSNKAGLFDDSTDDYCEGLFMGFQECYKWMKQQITTSHKVK